MEIRAKLPKCSLKRFAAISGLTLAGHFFSLGLSSSLKGGFHTELVLRPLLTLKF